ncbi:MAG: esterase [Bacteroidetes bacterium]|nr:esterase [Bacteroidota bacterium]
MKEEYHKWHSQYFEHEFEMLVYGQDGFPVIIFPTLNGTFYELKDNGIIESVSNLLDAGKIKIYCPQTIDYLIWNNFSIAPVDRAKSYVGYENVVLFDIIDFAKHETGGEKVALSGFGFGAYHALNTSFKHPDKVNHLICIDGLFDIKQFLENYYDDNCYFNNPPDYLPGLKDDWYLNRIKSINIFLAAGESDENLEQNKKISGLLNLKDVNHLLDIRPGTIHDWQLRCDIFREYMNQIFGQNL